MRQDAADLIARKLDRLPHPDGYELRFLEYSQFTTATQNDDIQQAVRERAQSVGEAVVHLLETNGYVITCNTDAVPTTEQRYSRTKLTCQYCGVQLIAFQVGPDLTRSVDPAVFLPPLQELQHDCAAP